MYPILYRFAVAWATIIGLAGPALGADKFTDRMHPMSTSALASAVAGSKTVLHASGGSCCPGRTSQRIAIGPTRIENAQGINVIAMAAGYNIRMSVSVKTSTHTGLVGASQR